MSVYTIKICIALSALGLASAYLNKYLLKSPLRLPDLSEWSFRLSLHWIAIIWILHIIPNHPIALLSAVATLVVSKSQIQKFPLFSYLFLVLTIPSLEKKIPGVLGVESLLYLSWPIAAGLTVIVLSSNNAPIQSKFKTIDRFLISVIFSLIVLLSFRNTTFTDGIRVAINYVAMIALPGLIVMRSLAHNRSTELITAVIAAGIFVCTIAIFENHRSWLLFIDLIKIHFPSDSFQISPYKFRLENLRAFSSLGNLQTALLASCTVLALFGLRSVHNRHWLYYAGLLVSAGGLIATQSRGAVFITIGLLGITFLLSMLRTWASATKTTIITLLFFTFSYLGVDTLTEALGVKNDSNLNYRIQLLEESISIISNTFLLGSTNYIEVLASKGLIQGEGIVDIVNTYLQVALPFGGIVLLAAIGLQARSVHSSLKLIEDEQKILKPASSYLISTVAISVCVYLQISSVSILGMNGIFCLYIALATTPLLHKTAK